MGRTLLASVLFVFCLGSLLYASNFKDIGEHPSCKYCGMDREKFAHGRMLIEYDDKHSFAACSLHCAAVDLANNLKKTPRRVLVADYNSKELIDAEKAFWVMGGDIRGVMTKRAKWAFTRKEDAAAFIAEHGGSTTTFDGALKTAYNDMYRSRKKKVRQASPTGPGPKDRCPVCGMFVAKYEKWVASLTFKDGTRAFFDGPKDMFRYLSDLPKYAPQRSRDDITEMHVTEYYTTRLVNAKNVHFVTGSNVLGPMGHELVPVKGKSEAETFLKDHGGEKLLTFEEVTPSVLSGLK